LENGEIVSTDAEYSFTASDDRNLIAVFYEDTDTDVSDEGTGVVETRHTTSLQVVGYYSILGQKLLQEPESGLYIIMYDTGKAEKVLK